MNDSDILNSQIVVINLVPSYTYNPGGGVVTIRQNIFNINNINLRFNPDYYRLEEISVSNNIPNDSQYVLSSSLSDNGPLLSFTGRTVFPINLSQVGLLKSAPNQISFSLNQIGPDLITANAGVGSLVTPVFADNTTCYISLSINFLKFRHKN